MGITRVFDCTVEKLLSGIIVVASSVVDVTLNILTDNVSLSEDGVIIAFSEISSNSMVFDESATARCMIYYLKLFSIQY